MNRPGMPLQALLLATCAVLLGRPCEGSEFNVYYRANVDSPWVFYAGKGTDAAANATAAELRAAGYSARIVAGDALSTDTAQSGFSTDSTVVVNRAVPPLTPYGPGVSGSWSSAWGDGLAGYSYGGGASYGGGGFRNADNWHHHDHSHEHSHEGHHDAHSASHHPTASPHHTAAAVHHGTGGHGGAHHGSHHGHSHSHSHHSHHGKK